MYSEFVRLETGVRQGSVLAPALFSVYMNDVVRACSCNSYGYIIVYADGILLITRSCSGLQHMFNEVLKELEWLCLNLNGNKSCCVKIGPGFDRDCRMIETLVGEPIKWVDEIRYLGIYILSSRSLSYS